MHRLLVAIGIALALALACTDDFDAFTVRASGATAGSAGHAAVGGVGHPNDAGDAAPNDGEPLSDVNCPAGQKPCGAGCVSETDPAHGCAMPTCSSCSTNHATVACDGVGACAIEQCDVGFADCNQLAGDGCETNILNGDPANCNGCGNVCTVANATPTCADGHCRIATCKPGYDDCDKDGLSCETNLNSPYDCGSCGNDCTVNAGQWVCNNGRCTVTQCPAGKRDCDSNPSDCETDVTTSMQNCGFCNNPCALPNATTECRNSQCVLIACNTGFADCDNVASDGCEINLNTDPDHCGSCTRTCSTTNVSPTGRSCAAGFCTSACMLGFGNCSKPAAPATDDGCESNLLTNPAHCGDCSRVCSSDNTTNLSCNLGFCDSPCQSGWANCLQPFYPVPDDGCESFVANSITDCGACGHACSTNNATSAPCNAGVCAPVCISTSYGDCSTPVAPTADDGCETLLDADTNNCGACGRSCDATHTLLLGCSAGLCDSSCQSGWGNCTEPLAPTSDDGCETSVIGDVSNCGGCGRVCSSANTTSVSCNGSVCTSSCLAGFGNCAMPVAPTPDDGCESTLANDTANCGACGRPCSILNATSTACSSGLCTPTCQSGFADCTEPAALTPDDGCETSTANDANNCGVCNYACPAGFVCTSSSCACDADSDCDAGSSGTCSSGLCVCGNGTICAVGERCLPNRSCG